MITWVFGGDDDGDDEDKIKNKNKKRQERRSRPSESRISVHSVHEVVRCRHYSAVIKGHQSMEL